MEEIACSGVITCSGVTRGCGAQSATSSQFHALNRNYGLFNKKIILMNFLLFGSIIKIFFGAEK
jgi:hypothetical protein